MPHRTRALAVLLALLAAACSDSDAGRALVERTDSAGVEIVRNLGADRPLQWTFEPVLSLGGADEGPEAFFRVGTRSVRTDARGNLFVLDFGNHRVVVFGPDGTHLRTVGGKGGGPGEIEIPIGLDVAPDGSVSVFDLRGRGFVRWDSAGGILPSQPVPLPLTDGFAYAADALIAPTPDPRSDDGLSRMRLLSMRAADTTELAAIAYPEPRMVQFSCVGLALPPIFTPALVWSAADDRVAVASEAGYAVVLRRPGRSSSIRRQLEPRAVTREMALQEVGEAMTIRFGSAAPPCRIPGAEVVEKQGFAPVLPAVGAIALSPDGSLWVKRGAVKGEDPVVDIFDGEGSYLGTLPPGSPFPVAFMPGGEVVALQKDEMDLDHVVVYRVRRGE